MQTVLTRDSTSIPWGFRLKGGAEYNVPLSILKVNEGSPSFTRLEVGDVIASIGNYPALNLKHEEALNIIRMFDCTLPLVIQRQQSLFNPSKMTAGKTNVSPIVWRPQSVSSYEQPYSPSATYSPQAYQPQVYQTNYQPPQPQVYKPQPQVYSPQVYSPKPQVYQPQFFPPTPPPAPPLPVIPPAPPLPDLSSAGQSYKPRQVDASYKKSESSSPVVPDALLNKVLSKSPMGQKPFSYTPGGLDLSHIRESARVKRYEQMSAHQEMTRSVRQASVGPEFGYQQPRYQAPSQYQNYSPQPPMSAIYNPPQAPPPPPPASVYQPSTLINRSSSVSNENFAPMSPKQIRPAQKTQSPTGFSITPEQLMKARRDNGEKRDMMNQSFSFKMLNKWISDSESSSPIQLVSKKDEEESLAQPKPTFIKSEVIKALEEDENKQNRIRQSQSPQSVQSVKLNPSNIVPSKVFQYVDRKFSESSETSVENHHRAPARERDQEPPVPKYKGNCIPSKTFKYLQYITQNETETSVQTNSNSQPVIQQTQVQVATTNRSTPTHNEIHQQVHQQFTQQQGQQIQQQQQVSHESYVKQQAKHHSIQEVSQKNSTSVSFPAFTPADPVEPDHSVALSQNVEPTKPDLVLSSTIEDVVDTVIKSSEVEQESPVVDDEPQVEEHVTEVLESTQEPQVEQIQILDESVILIEKSDIPDSLSITNNQVINTDINLNQINTEETTSQFVNVEQSEQDTKQQDQVIDSIIQEVVETSEF